MATAPDRGFLFFFFNDTATTEIYTLSLHDALPIYLTPVIRRSRWPSCSQSYRHRSEEHTSELQSPMYLVCRLLLEKKKKQNVRNSPKFHSWFLPTLPQARQRT